MDRAVLDGQSGLTLNYTLLNDSAAPFRIGLYQSDDSQFNAGDSLLGSVVLSAPADLAAGPHTRLVSIGHSSGQIPLPGAGSAETKTDYSILAQADDLNLIQDADNTAAVSGAYHPAGGPVYLQGTADDDTLATALGAPLITVNFNAASYTYAPGDVTSLRVRLHGGNDVLDNSALPTPLFIVGGTGSDTFTGGTGNDTFEFASTPGNGTTLNGGDGTNILDGPGSANLWNISGGNAGTLNGIPFQNIQNLTGGAGQDTFVLGAGGNLAGSINGGVYNPEDALIGLGQDNTWNITSGNAGTLNGIFFHKLPNLTGGPVRDTFTFGATLGYVSGTITGGGGDEILDYSARSALIVVNLQSLTATGTSGISGITGVIGGSNAANLLYSSNGTNTWNVTGNNSGDINVTFSFSNFGTLHGSPDPDTFVFGTSGNLAGTINGASTSGEWLDYSAYSTPITVNLALGTASHTGGILNLQNVRGGNGGNLLIGNNRGNILVGGNGNDSNAEGGGRSVLIGGNGQDTVNGDSADDILISGFTDFDDNNAVLASILSEWQLTGAGHPYATRVSDLRNGGGLNGTNKLVFGTGAGTTVHDDGSTDTLTGNAGTEWYFQGLNDVINGLIAGEQVN